MSSTSKRVPIPRNGDDYRGKVVLAPMVRSGECPSRLLALKYGADLVWGPETVDRSMIGTTRKVNPHTSCIEWTRWSTNGGKGPKENQRESVIYRLHPEKERGKLIFQVGTASPELAVEATKLVAADVAGIDVNAGCPKPFSTTGGMGAALLQDPERLASILEALVREVGSVFEIGISVKIRLLETPERTRALVERLCGTGIAGLTIHCRTTPMRPRERAIRDQLRMIGNICREAGVACLMNGDVTTRDEAMALAVEYGVDGGMIATAAEANSSVFRSDAEGGPLGWQEVSSEYIKLALEVRNRWGNTKFLLAQLMPGKVELVKKALQAKNYTAIVEVMDLNDLKDLAREVDEHMGITDRNETAVSKAQKKQTAKAAGRQPTNKPKEAKRPLSERGVTIRPQSAREEESPLVEASASAMALAM